MPHVRSALGIRRAAVIAAPALSARSGLHTAVELTGFRPTFNAEANERRGIPAPALAV